MYNDCTIFPDIFQFIVAQEMSDGAALFLGLVNLLQEEMSKSLAS